MLDVVGLTVSRRNGVPIIKDVTFAVRKAELYVLLGPPGSGKSVVIETLLGWRVPDHGHVRLLGTDVSRDPLRARRDVTYVAGTGALVPTLSIRRNVQWFLQLAGAEACPRPAIDRALRAADIPDRHFGVPARSVLPHEHLSVWLAIAALRRSAVVLLDDPARDLSALASEYLVDQLDVLRSRGTAIVVTSRDGTFGATVGHRVGALDGGVKIAEYEHAPQGSP